MVISLAYLERLEVGIDILSYRLAVDKVHRCACDRLALAERDLCLVCRKVFRCIHAEDMSEDVSVALSVEVEVCMVCEVDHSRSVRLRSECETKLAVFAPVVACDCLHSAGIALLSCL